jgi:hypothetical protein
MLIHRTLPFIALVGGAACADAIDPNDLAMPMIRTTSSELAIRNLDAEVDALQLRLESAAGRPQIESTVERLLDRLLLRAQVLGRLDDLDRAQELAERPDLGPDTATQLRARIASARHAFSDVLAGPSSTRTERRRRQAALIAVGRASEVADELAAAAESGEFGARVLWAAAAAELGRFAEADAALVSALTDYRDVSPFVVGQLYFRRGVMWAEQAARPDIGLRMYAAGLAVLPEHPTMAVHMAELEWEEGQPETARRRLETLPDEVSDPEVDGLLAELYAEEGRTEAAALRVAAARRRYDALLERHRLAFADHGSEFFAGPGGDPERGLALALDNLANRPDQRAYLLALDAAEAVGDRTTACRLVDALADAPVTRVELVRRLAALRSGC